MDYPRLQDLQDPPRRSVIGRSRTISWRASTRRLKSSPWRPCPRKRVRTRPIYGIWRRRSHLAPRRSAKLHHLHSVFFAPGSPCPASFFRDSRLSAGTLLHLCGDIETNPGPVEARPKTKRTQAPRKAQKSQKSKQSTNPKSKPTAKDPVMCDWCKKVLRSNQIEAALTCSKKSCKRKCHRQHKCSQISKYNTNPVWLCNVHNPEPSHTRVRDLHTM